MLSSIDTELTATSAEKEEDEFTIGYSRYPKRQTVKEVNQSTSL